MAARSTRLGIASMQNSTDDDVRLTIGGEPTFVLIDDPDGAGVEHHGDRADEARAVAANSIERLKARFAPEGMLHFGQGKWYPGEQLPRWAFSLLLARRRQADVARSERRSPTKSVDYGANDRSRRAHSSKESPAARLPCGARGARVRGSLVLHRLRNARYPRTSTRSTTSSTTRWRATRLARVFERGLGTPVGFVLPVQRWQRQRTNRGVG